MDYIEAAAALGQALVDSPQFKKMSVAEAETFADAEATGVLVAYRKAQQEMAEAAGGGRSAEELDEIRNRLLEKQKELSENQIIKNYLDSKKAFDQMMQEVNSVLKHYLESGSADCSGSCETCGGCG